MAQSAPGRHYREGLSLVELLRRFPDDATAEAWFVSVRWPDGVRCPRCGSEDVQERPTRRPQPYRCRACRRDFSVKTDTLMHSSPLGLQTWALAIFLCSTHLKGVASMKLHRDLGVTQKTAWHLAHRIRETWAGGAEPFTRAAEVDETYVGGKRKNMPAHKRREMTGRGPVGKAVVAGAVERETGRVQAAVVEDTTGPTLRRFVRERVEPGAALFTDEAHAYRGMPEYAHEAVCHSVGEYVRGMAHTNGIESFWAELKRGYTGVFHKMSPKHPDRYVREFAGRRNLRTRDTLDAMRAMAGGLPGRRLRYRDLIAQNGLPSGARAAVGGESGTI